MDLVSGPLDRRVGHVYDALEALYVADNGSQLIVRSGRTPPRLPRGYVLLGRYVTSLGERALVWHGMEAEQERDGFRVVARASRFEQLRRLARWLLGGAHGRTGEGRDPRTAEPRP